MSTLVGKRIGEYQVKALLGEGGMATVYRARRSDMEDDIALKVIQPEFIADEEGRRQFLLEMEAMVRLDHPNA